MANSINKNFRATSGFDAANQKIINVATADRNVLTDGVNVDYFIKENTIQQYDPSRSYPDRPAYYAGFTVIYSNRIWTAKRDIPSPAGPFFDAYWEPLREDPKWIPISEGARQILPGDYITVNTMEGKAITLTLPATPSDGDTVTVKDVGGRPGFVDVIIKAPVQSILDRGKQVQQVMVTIPFSQLEFVYNNNLWNLATTEQADIGKTVSSSSSGVVDVQAGENILRNYDANKAIAVRLPKNANNGDMVHFVGMDSTNPALYHLIVNTYDNTTSVESSGTTVFDTRRAINGYFVYDSLNKLWRLFDSDTRTRLRYVTTDTTLFPNDAVVVTGYVVNNSTPSTVNLNLPTNVAIGDTVEINLTYLRSKQVVNIKPATGDLILASTAFLQYPKASNKTSSVNPWDTLTSITYDGTSSYLPVLTLSYYEEGTGVNLKKYWIVRDNNIITERVDPSSDTNRARLGVIALATQAQANLDYEQITPASKEVAITPETLANRTALTTRRGIARLATVSEVNGLGSDGAWNPDIIVTPMTLDKKQATEDMRGLAEIATQAEANTMGGSADDSRIITAKKLDARRATPTQSGIVLTVANGGVAPVAGPTITRDTAGTLIYNFNDKANVVTPSTLREYIATDLALGSVYLATDAEVRGGTPASDAKHPIVVTPSALEKKIATDALIGFTQVAKQPEVDAGVDYFKFVTPKTLNDRKAREDLTGIAKLATQTEFNAGTAALISGPDKVKSFFSDVARTSVTSAAGMTQSGNLWDGITFNIVPSSTVQRGTARLATQAEVTAGTDNTTIVTPLTLQGKKATVSAEGIIQLASQAEVVAGTNTNKAVVPNELRNVIQVDTGWQATSTTRGTVKLSELASTWQGDSTSGNKNINLSVFASVGMAISPYEFNKTLRNYLPLNATADNSVLHNGLTDQQFIRRDINQTVNGSLTLTQPTTAAAIIASGTVTVNSLLSANNITLNKTGNPADDSNIKNAGLNLYGTPQATTGRPAYGIHMSRTDGTIEPNGNHGYANGSWATYFTQSPSQETRAWIFQSINGTTLTNVASVSTSGAASFNDVVNSDVSFRLKGNNSLWVDGNNAIQVGNTGQQLYLNTPNASDLRVTENGGATYQIITGKNLVTEANKTYVRKDGDTITGRLNVTQPLTFTLPESSVGVGTAGPTTNNFGSWICNITNATLIAGLPGYLVGVFDIDAATGQPTRYYKEYKEFKGQGTLSQFGSSNSDGAGTYQIWAPRPTVTTENHMASTYYVRHWNPVLAKWDGWSRIYTSSNPPLNSDIGAISNNDTTFDSLKIRSWFQIDHIKMWADPVSRSVKFEWVD